MRFFDSMEQNAIEDELEDACIILRPSDVSELLDLHPNTVYRLLQSGKLPACKLGGSWRIYRKDLIDFIKKHSV